MWFCVSCVQTSITQFRCRGLIICNSSNVLNDTSIHYCRTSEPEQPEVVYYRLPLATSEYCVVLWFYILRIVTTNKKPTVPSVVIQLSCLERVWVHVVIPVLCVYVCDAIQHVCNDCDRLFATLRSRISSVCVRAHCRRGIIVLTAFAEWQSERRSSPTAVSRVIRYVRTITLVSARVRSCPCWCYGITNIFESNVVHRILLFYCLFAYHIIILVPMPYRRTEMWSK